MDLYIDNFVETELSSINMRLKKNRLLIFCLALFLPFSLGAQQKEVYTDSWFFAGFRLKLGEHWSVFTEGHIRITHFLKHWEQFIIRPSVSYKLNSTVQFSAGYSFVRSYPFTSYMKPFPVNEHNVWEQVKLNHHTGIVHFSHRFRWEQRFHESFLEDSLHNFHKDGYFFSQRIRYRFGIKVPFAKRFFFKTFDEIKIRMKGNFEGLDFDKNWIYGGFGYQFPDNITLELGYLHQVIKITPDLYQMHPTLILAINYDIGLLQKKGDTDKK